MPNLERTDRMKRAMEDNSLDLLVLRLPENVLLLSGYWPMIGASVLLFSAEGTSVLITPDCYMDETLASASGVEIVPFPYGSKNSGAPATQLFKLIADIASKRNWRRVGFEDDFVSVAPSWNSAEAIVPTASARGLLHAAFSRSELVDATTILLEERKIKTRYEAKRVDLASEISVFGLEAFQNAVEIGVSGVELAALVEKEVMVRGSGYRDAVRVRGYAQVTVGPKETFVSHRPNVISTTRRLADGEAALLELGVVADGYWAVKTRVRVAGAPSDEQVKVFDTVVKAQETAIAAIRPGVRASEIDAAARAVIVDAGYGDAFPHVTGHGFGFGYHESSPILAPHSIETLEAGTLTSVEPGIYLPTIGGFRVEDDVLVTSTGARVLGPYKKALT